MYLPKSASRRRQLEAEAARNNRLEIVNALSQGQITRRDLLRWGIFTTAGTLAFKNGLSPYAPSAYAAVPTGTPRSPLFNAKKFSEPMPRAIVPPRYDLNKLANNSAQWINHTTNQIVNELPAKNWSYHNDYNASGGTAYKNPATGVGPCEGRPDGEFFAHQRWDELFPKYGFLLSIGQVKAGSKFNSAMPEQAANAIWSFGARTPGMRGNIKGTRTANAAPTAVQGALRRADPHPHLQQHAGRPRPERRLRPQRDAAALPQRPQRRGERRRHRRAPLPRHLLRLPLEHHARPARQDQYQRHRQARRLGPDDGNGGLVKVPGDFREIQGTMWAHDHRFFFTAENVYKGNARHGELLQRPRSRQRDLTDGINLQLPSGSALRLGQRRLRRQPDHLRRRHRPDGQLFFDIFTTDGFLGDMPLVNFAYAPFIEVLPRKYRFRILNACMSRFFKLALQLQRGAGAVQVHRQRRQLRRQPDHADGRSTSRASPSATTSSSTSRSSRSATRIYLVNLLRCETTAAGRQEALSLAAGAGRRPRRSRASGRSWSSGW